MVTLPGNRILLFGGLDAAERRLDDLWVLDLTTASWSEVKTTGSARPKPRYGQALLRVEQRVLLFGGEAASGVGGDLWALRGVVTVDGDVPPLWLPLELPGTQPPARKGHAATCMCVGGWWVGFYYVWLLHARGMDGTCIGCCMYCRHLMYHPHH